MEALAGRQIELGLPPRPEHQAGLGLQQGLAARAGKAGDEAVVGGVIIFLAQAEDGAQPRRPAGGVLGIEAEVEQVQGVGVAGAVHRGGGDGRAARLLDLAIVQHRAVEGVAAVDIGLVVAELGAEHGIGGDSGEVVQQMQRRRSAGEGAVVGLLLLVALHRVVDEVGEIVEQDHALAHHIAVGGQPPAVAACGVVGRQAHPLRQAAVGWIECAEAVDQAGLDGAERLVGGEIALAMEIERGKVVAVIGRAVAVA
jgi:hypothetical protein